MTAKIHVLSDRMKNQIAAGEVVERPASVVKELMENAIDAGAATIDIVVEGGGRTRIGVSDDGEGMGGEDAVSCLARHATSKLHAPGDLKSIATLGFRGEALPAIASVSDMTIVTRVRGEDHAREVRVRHGNPDPPRDAARGPGTTVTVRNLFALTPARSKFLKSNTTEVRWITQVFTAYAMAFPKIAFSLTIDGRKTANHVGTGGREERVQDVLGSAHRWLRLAGAGSAGQLEGFISEPDAGRSAPNHVFFFVNGRWVSSRPLMQTLLRAYSPFVVKGRYPAAVVYLDVPPGEVDVNVHPTKREVKFREPAKVSGELFRAVEDRLRSSRLGRLSVSPPSHQPFPQSVRDVQSAYARHPIEGERQTTLGVEAPVQPTLEPAASQPAPKPPGHPVLATLAGTYFDTIDGDDLVLVDQHAAHERVLYEEAERALRGTPQVRQSLLLPLTLDLTPDEARVLEEYGEEISKLGFEVSAFGGRSVLVEGVPAGLRRWEHGQALRDILDEMGKGGKPPEDRISKVAASYACHTSVKAGDSMEPEEQRALLGRLFSCRDWHRCPHGRPTIVRLDRAEIEKRFRRP